MKLTHLVVALLVLVASAAAQVKNPIATALKEVLPNRQKNTIEAVEAMPADKFSYKPSADQMTFGLLVALSRPRSISAATRSPGWTIRNSAR